MMSPHAPSSRSHVIRCGFTLIEMLAVLVILSLVAGLGASGLASTHESAQIREAAALVRDHDQLARINARTSGPVQLVPIEEGSSITVIEMISRSTIRQVQLPRGVRVSLLSEVDSNSIPFDRSGHSPDYQIVLSTADRSRRWRVNGLTGLIRSAGGPS